MYKITALLLLLLVDCTVSSQNNQDLNLVIYECKKAGLRAVALYDSEGILFIQCRLYKRKRL